MKSLINLLARLNRNLLKEDSSPSRDLKNSDAQIYAEVRRKTLNFNADMRPSNNKLVYRGSSKLIAVKNDKNAGNKQSGTGIYNQKKE